MLEKQFYVRDFSSFEYSSNWVDIVGSSQHMLEKFAVLSNNFLVGKAMKKINMKKSEKMKLRQYLSWSLSVVYLKSESIYFDIFTVVYLIFRPFFIFRSSYLLFL